MKARTLWRLHPTFDWDVSSAHRPNADYGEMQSYRTATNACFSPEQRTRAFKLAKVYQQTGVVPERDRRFFCYSRFPLSVEDMDTLSAFHPMYRHAVRISPSRFGYTRSGMNISEPLVGIALRCVLCPLTYAVL